MAQFQRDLHGQSGGFHVFVVPSSRADQLCRQLGLETTSNEDTVLGCHLASGPTEVIVIADTSEIADTFAHEWQHSKEGPFHP